ncbi:MAG: glycoside hydrolase [Holosporaceae bacterium]|jgi:hypothetical protein|nr:glycoside hydrolase [Holosporaceae bacterium]
MKKILILVAGVSQLLLLPQINAVNEHRGIAVPENFEVENGLLGLDRDANLKVARNVVKGSTLTTAQKRIRNLYGISEETFERQQHQYFRHVVSLELKKRVFQQQTNARPIPLDSATFMASNGVGTLVAIRHSYTHYFDDHIMYSTDEGHSWHDIENIFAKKVKYINGRFFAFGAARKEYKENSSEFVEKSENIYVSDDGIAWTRFFRPWTNSAKHIETMAYGDGKYVVVTGDGTVFTKTKDGTWQEHSASTAGLVLLDEQEEKIEKPNNSVFSLIRSRNYDYEDKKLGDIEIVYARGNFVLKFTNSESITHICTSGNGINWRHVRSGESSDFMPGNLVGGHIGFAYKGEENQLYYSLSGNDWDKVELPEKPGKSSKIHNVLYLGSYGGVFVAPADSGADALLGIPIGDGVRWFWAELNLSLFGNPILSRLITNNNRFGKRIIMGGRGLVAYLQDYDR